MKILLVAATREEIAPSLVDFVPSSGNKNNPQKFFFRGIEIDLLITGAGMTATAFHLGKILSQSRFDLAVNAGICGSFEKKIKIGDVVRVSEDSFADAGAEDGEKFISLSEMGFQNKNDFPFNEGFLKNNFEIKNKCVEELMEVRGITVNTVHGNEESIRRVIKRCNPQVETMEGASFFYSCLSENIPCLQIRAVSNYVERRNRAAWNIPLATGSLSEKWIQILDSF